jgi:choline dehydrogenase-like flavoprotein
MAFRPDMDSRCQRRNAPRRVRHRGFPLNSVGEMVDIPMTAHFLGGCTIGDSPQSGVVDPYHRMYGHPGCTSSMALPSRRTGSQPALTITARQNGRWHYGRTGRE